MINNSEKERDNETRDLNDCIEIINKSKHKNRKRLICSLRTWKNSHDAMEYLKCAAEPRGWGKINGEKPIKIVRLPKHL